MKYTLILAKETERPLGAIVLGDYTSYEAHRVGVAPNTCMTVLKSSKEGNIHLTTSEDIQTFMLEPIKTKVKAIPERDDYHTLPDPIHSLLLQAITSDYESIHLDLEKIPAILSKLKGLHPEAKPIVSMKYDFEDDDLNLGAFRVAKDAEYNAEDLDRLLGMELTAVYKEWQDYIATVEARHNKDFELLRKLYEPEQ